MAFSGERFQLAAGGYRAEIAEVGAALAGLWLDEVPVTVESGPDELPPKSTGAVLLPWPNRLRDGHYRFDGTEYQLPLTEPATHNASHGLVKWARWVLLEGGGTSVTVRHDVVPQPGYPFELRLTLRYALDPVAGLTVTVSAVNTGELPAPFGAGFHPYLDLADHELASAELLIPAGTVLRTDERQLPVQRLPVDGTPFDLRQLRPIGELRLDHGFADLTGTAAVLRTERRTVELHWETPWKYLQVYTPPFITPGRNAVAIEPMSCPANAFNSGEDLIRLEPGAEWSASWGIAVTG